MIRAQAKIASQNFKIRTVVIPMSLGEGFAADPEDVLEMIFKYGQNDFQNVPGSYSVSVGDIVYLPVGSGRGHYIVEPAGFRAVTIREMIEYQKMDEGDRWKYARGYMPKVGA